MAELLRQEEEAEHERDGHAREVQRQERRVQEIEKSLEKMGWSRDKVRGQVRLQPRLHSELWSFPAPGAGDRVSAGGGEDKSDDQKEILGVNQV